MIGEDEEADVGLVGHNGDFCMTVRGLKIDVAPQNESAETVLYVLL